MGAARLHDALDRLSAAIRDVEAGTCGVAVSGFIRGALDHRREPARGWRGDDSSDFLITPARQRVEAADLES